MKKKVLVTGSSGFLGSHLVDALELKGFKVVLFDSKPSKYKSKNQTEIIGDILNFEELQLAIKGCHAVFHFAGQADIETSNKYPQETMEVNILGTQNILEASRLENIERFLFASTIYVYSELGSFYKVSKQSSEKIIEEYQKQFNLDYTILRFGSVYGPRSNNFNSINLMLNQALNNKKIIRPGDGEEIREYIHAKDAAKLSMNALDKKFINKHLIITGIEKIRIKDLVSMINEIFGGEIKVEFGKEIDEYHYSVTPYNYKPQIAKKVIADAYYDLGQGLLDQIYDIKSDLKMLDKK